MGEADIGELLRIIVIGSHLANPWALVEFKSATTACFVKEALNGAIESDLITVRLKVEFSRTKSLHISTNDEYRWDFSLRSTESMPGSWRGGSRKAQIASDEVEEVQSKFEETAMGLNVAHQQIEELQNQLAVMSELFKYREEEVAKRNKKFMESLSENAKEIKKIERGKEQSGD